jgi:hypothetical protein
MDKFAQERGFFNKVREKMNMPGSYLEKFFKPELERIMAALRLVDDKVRAELSGKQIGDSSPQIERAAKDILRDARRNFARREYMTGIADLGMFHKKMALVAAEISKWEVDVNRIHHRFLFQGVDEDKIKGLREHMEGKKAAQINELVKQAGIMDFFYNLVSPRGRGLAAYEKKYPKITKDLRDGGAKLLDSADNLLANTISLLKEMATARATRRPDDYMDSANKIVAEYNKFDGGDKGFRAYYQNAVLPFMKIKDEVESKIKAEKPDATPVTVTPPQRMELGYQVEAPAGGAPASPSAPSASPQVPDLAMPAPRATQPMTQPPGASPPFAPQPDQTITVNPEDPDVEIISPPPGEKTEPSPPPKHSQFYAMLEKMGKEDPRVVSGFISKYAKSIQATDPETAITLFSISKRMKG